jgi:alkanesulfonate monooxygenase SsuD/methylene tetrahydromethanopterin reductase-like flavin-dependent oxidoreductase (luciferase family)
MAGIGIFNSPGRSLAKGIERAARADELGFDSIYTTHIATRDSLAVLTAFATATTNAKLGTGVLPIFSRTPCSTAQTAATIDELSGGRMVIGLGVSHKVTVENWFDSKIVKPVAQMREYAGIVRAILTGEQPPDGEFFNSKFQFMGYEAREDLPIYIGALSPNMLQLAGEIGDGVMLWLCGPEYIERVVIPEVTKGREKAGKTIDGFDVVAAVPVGLTDDPGAAREAMRGQLLTYASLPFYRKMLEASGWSADIAAFDAGMADGDADKAKAGLSDEMIDSLIGAGDAEAVRSAVKRYQDAGTVSPCIGGLPGGEFDAAMEAVTEML